MMILTAILNKIFLFTFFMAILNIIRQVYNFGQTFFASAENETIKFLLPTTELILLLMSVAFVFTSIFGGIFL